jgi:RNA polymerase sigma-70 factor, ECF subfamily
MRPELKQASDLLRKDSPEAIEEALRLLQNTVYSFSMKVCGHPEDAEDTMQEVLYRSIHHLSRIEDPKALAVWLYTVTRNRCWRMRRKGSGAAKRTMSLDELMPDGADLERILRNAERNPEGRAIDAQETQMLHQAVLRIPAALRMVLVLHDMEELSTDEVATVLGLKPGTVRVRLHRARLAVRKEMSRTLGQEKPGRKPRASRKVKPRAKASPRPPQCREIFANLSEYLDGKVPSPACDQMREHIEACPSCVAFLGELRTAIDRCRSLEVNCDSQVAPRLRSMLTQEYLRMLKGAAK